MGNGCLVELLHQGKFQASERPLYLNSGQPPSLRRKLTLEFNWLLLLSTVSSSLQRNCINNTLCPKVPCEKICPQLCSNQIWQKVLLNCKNSKAARNLANRWKTCPKNKPKEPRTQVTQLTLKKPLLPTFIIVSLNFSHIIHGQELFFK